MKHALSKVHQSEHVNVSRMQRSHSIWITKNVCKILSGNFLLVFRIERAQNCLKLILHKLRPDLLLLDLRDYGLYLADDANKHVKKCKRPDDHIEECQYVITQLAS